MPYIPPPVAIHASAVQPKPVIAASQDFVAAAVVEQTGAFYNAQIYIFNPTCLTNAPAVCLKGWRHIGTVGNMTANDVDVAILSNGAITPAWNVVLTHKTLVLDPVSGQLIPGLRAWFSEPILPTTPNSAMQVGTFQTIDRNVVPAKHRLLSFNGSTLLCAAWALPDQSIWASFASIARGFDNGGNSTKTIIKSATLPAVTDFDTGEAGGLAGPRVVVTYCDSTAPATDNGIFVRMSNGTIDFGMAAGNWRGDFSVASDADEAKSAVSCSIIGTGKVPTLDPTAPVPEPPTPNDAEGNNDPFMILYSTSGDKLFTLASDESGIVPTTNNIFLPVSDTSWNRPVQIPLLGSWEIGAVDLQRYAGFGDPYQMGLVAAVGVSRGAPRNEHGIALLSFNPDFHTWGLTTIQGRAGGSPPNLPVPRVATNSGFPCSAWVIFSDVIGVSMPWVIDAPLEDPGDISGSPGGAGRPGPLPKF